MEYAAKMTPDEEYAVPKIVRVRTQLFRGLRSLSE